MQDWQTKLLATINSIQGQNNYWTSIYRNVELGLTKKLAELEALKRENQELRVQHQLDSLLTSKKSSSATAVKSLIDPNNLPPEVALRIQRLEDQVRARDLVIELLFTRLCPSELTGRDKRQQEKAHEEMQKKLDVRLQRLESELGLPGPRGKGVEGNSGNDSTKNGKRSREIQTDETEHLVSGTGVKRLKAAGPNPYPSPESENNSLQGSPGSNGRVGERVGGVDEESTLEQSLADAFREFNEDLGNGDLEDLFADSDQENFMV